MGCLLCVDIYSVPPCDKKDKSIFPMPVMLDGSIKKTESAVRWFDYPFSDSIAENHTFLKLIIVVRSCLLQLFVVRACVRVDRSRTTLDDSGQFGTKCCAIIVGSKMMVLVYPLSMSFFAAQRIFAGCRTVRLVTECSSRPAERP